MSPDGPGRYQAEKIMRMVLCWQKNRDRQQANGHIAQRKRVREQADGSALIGITHGAGS
jgi:hypothetical protein